MKLLVNLALVAALAGTPAFAQDVSAYSTTILQNWKQDVPGLNQGTLTPATEFLGIDVNRMDGGALSLHLYGWGMVDLADQSSVYGTTNGDLTYGYLEYNFNQANAELKAGRFTVNAGVGNEIVDGAYARTDLRCGFTVSAFFGTPVVYKNLAYQSQATVGAQQNLIFGGRLAWHAASVGTIGVDLTEDGTSPGSPSPAGAPAVDYTRRLVGADVKLDGLAAWLDLSGRTVFDTAPRVSPGPDANSSRIAEDDYTATFKVATNLSLAGTFVERNLFAYYAGSTLPNLFDPNEQGMFKATGAKVTWLPVANLQVVGDVRRTDREAYGSATRAGGDVRYNFTDAHVLAGAGYHKVNAFTLQAQPASLIPSYSLTHSEMRAWAMVQRGPFSASLDGILFHYDDAGANPNLNGHSHETAVVGSVGYQVKDSMKVSGDLTVGDTPLFQKEVMGLVRFEYRFGVAGKGDK
jgi:hypothetical protein